MKRIEDAGRSGWGPFLVAFTLDMSKWAMNASTGPLHRKKAFILVMRFISSTSFWGTMIFNGRLDLHSLCVLKEFARGVGLSKVFCHF